MTEQEIFNKLWIARDKDGQLYAVERYGKPYAECAGHYKPKKKQKYENPK